MTKVAADYGISDVALKKICIKHRIPAPARGDWAKKAAGKKVQRAYFRTISDPTIERILIHGSPTKNWPEEVKQAQASARKREQKSENKIVVPGLPETLHPLVERTVKKLDRSTSSEKNLINSKAPNLFNVEIASESIERVTAFLNALVIASEERGYLILKGKEALTFSVEQELIQFNVIEQLTRTKHEPTKAELETIQNWERQRNLNNWNTFSWFNRPSYPEWDYTPNGLLKVSLDVDCYLHDGLRRSFGDGKTQRIEALINTILEALATWAAAIKDKRIEREEQDRKWQEEAVRLENKRRLQALENKRIEPLTQGTECWHQRQRILTYIKAVEHEYASGQYQDKEDAKEWIIWAKEYAARLDPLRDGPPKILQYDDFDPWELR